MFLVNYFSLLVAKPKRSYVRKIKPPPLQEPLTKIFVAPEVNLAPKVLNSNNERINECGYFEQESPQNSDDFVELNMHHHSSIVSQAEDSFNNETQLIKYLDKKFGQLKIEMESQNALVRQNIVLARQTSKNMKTYFENESFDGFLSDFDIVLPVSSEIELRDLEMRCLDDEFRKSFVRFYKRLIYLLFYTFFFLLHTTYLRKYFSKSKKNISTMVGKVIVDELIDLYNWSGRSGKKDLSSFKIFSKVLYGKFIFY